MHLPLRGWRVVELTDIRGAMCGRMLADLGASVTSVVTPGPVRPPPLDVAAAYREAGKEIVELDPSTDAGRDRLEERLARADVLVENLDRDRRSQWGLQPQEVARRHPALVHAVMADFGLSGPRAGWKLEPLPAQASGGTMFASGFPELPPCWFPGFLGPDCASVYALVGIVAAVMDRVRHGRGQVIEVSVQEATLAGTNPWGVAVPDYLKINPFLPAEGRRNAEGIYWVLPASDGWIRTVIGNDKQWQGFVHLLRDPDALTSSEWADPFFRRMNGDVVRLVAADLLTDRTRSELFEEARRLGATVGVIHQPSEYLQHEQTTSREVFAPSHLPGLEGGPMVRPPLRFSCDAVTAGSGVPSAPVEEPGRLLLDGVTVVEFGMAAIGPEASLVLSEMGADVVKVESRAHLDVLRSSGFDRINCGFAFNAECRGRRSVALDLGTEAGRRLAFELCGRADVIVENYRGGVLDRFGLGYEAVKAANPSVVYASSQGYGSSGPLAEMPAYGPLNLGFVGLHLLWNHPDAPYPCGTSLNHPDHLAGKFLASAVLIALDHRRRTGEGQRVDLAQTDFAAYLRGEVYLQAWREGADPTPAGNSSLAACPHGVFPSAGDDRWIAIGVGDDRSWRALCQVLGWEDDPELASLDQRLGRAGDIERRLVEWTRKRDAGEAASELQAAGVSAVPVMGPLDHLADGHLADRRFIVTLQHPEVGSERHAGNPLRMSRTPQRIAGPAPCLGADTFEVLNAWLGLDRSEVDRLTAEGVCA